MDTLTRAAIVKAASEKLIKDATAELEPSGDLPYQIDTTVRIHGTITKGKDFDQLFWNTLPLMGMVFRIMNEAGIVLGKGRVKKMVADILENDLTSEELLAEKDLKKWVKAAQEELSSKATRTATGKTTSSLAVEVIADHCEPYAVETEIETPVKA